MRYSEAKILIDEAHNLHYRGTAFEQNFVKRLERLQPSVLSDQDRLSVIEFYRRATGGGHIVKQYQPKNNPYIPED